MTDTIITRMVAFNNDNELANSDKLLEIVDRTADGSIEVAVDVPRGTNRVYLRFALHDLVREVMAGTK